MSFNYTLPSGWRWETIEAVQATEPRSIVTGPFGSAISSKYFVADGVPVIRGNNLSLERKPFLDEGFVFLTVEKASEFKKLEAHEDDLVFTAAGTIGQVSIIPKNAKYPRYIISNKQMRARLNTSIVCPMYAYYWFTESYVRELICSRNTGSTIPLINLSVLKSLPIPIPPLSVQNQIVRVAKSLDDKINLNRQINQTLEAIAQAIFKSWFVDFDPVKAKIAAKQAGRDPLRAAMGAISGKSDIELDALPREQYEQLAATAALFPDEMEDSALGEIPKGWALRTIRDVAQFSSGKVDVTSLNEDLYISTENMIENRAGVARASTLPSVSSVPSFSTGQVLVSNIRPYFKKIWLARFNGGRSPDVLAFAPTATYLSEFLYNLMYQDSFFEFMTRTAKGAKMPRGDKDAIMGWQFAYPEEVLTIRFSELVKPFYCYIDDLVSQNKSLVELRNALLPKFLSGELPIPSSTEPSDNTGDL